MNNDVPTEAIGVWESAVGKLKKVERRLGHEQFTPELRGELVEALNSVDDAWELHISSVRAWAAGGLGPR
jgi:hypothetical protein